MSEAPQRQIQVVVPAKVNLHLGVGPRRADGFHELRNVFHAVDLYDVVTVAEADHDQLRVTAPAGSATPPQDASNLAWQAAELVRHTIGSTRAVSIHLDKRIPMAGGMAGGSADAAATLLACRELWQAAELDLVPLAAQLGSDVPFALLGGTAIGTGRGEQLRPLPCGATLHWAFAFASFGVSTAAAYRRLDELRAASVPADRIAGAGLGEPTQLYDALRTGDVSAVAGALVNDLQPATLELVPALRRTLDGGLRHGALAALVSGSGPTCAFLCPDTDAAERVAAGLLADGLCAASYATYGPVPGAQVPFAVPASVPAAVSAAVPGGASGLDRR